MQGREENKREERRREEKGSDEKRKEDGDGGVGGESVDEGERVVQVMDGAVLLSLGGAGKTHLLDFGMIACVRSVHCVYICCVRSVCFERVRAFRVVIGILCPLSP